MQSVRRVSYSRIRATIFSSRSLIKAAALSSSWSRNIIFWTRRLAAKTLWVRNPKVMTLVRKRRARRGIRSQIRLLRREVAWVS